MVDVMLYCVVEATHAPATMYAKMRLELPGAPTEGLTVRFADTDARVTDVAYDVEEGVYQCQVSVTFLAQRTAGALESLAAKLRGGGWDVRVEDAV